MAYILFADDEPEAVEFPAADLTGQGHWCVVVRNGLDALAQIGPEVPDILVTDLTMPGTHGYAVMREVWRSHPEKPVGIVLLTTISAESEPGRSWTKDWPINAYVLVLRHRATRPFAWPMVLAVEQLLYRQLVYER